MRPDMFEVIIERPRSLRPNRNGSSYPRRKLFHLFEQDLEGAPQKLGMRAGHKDKCLNENLAPLRRFLRANVGRPWNKVRSEIAEHISASSAVQKHLLDHLADFVVEQVTLIDGKPHGLARYWIGRGPLYDGPGWRGTLYVCPKTGLLRVAPVPPRPPLADQIVPLDPFHELRRIEGVWWHVTLAGIRAPDGSFKRYVVTKREPGKRELSKLRAVRPLLKK